MNEAPKMTPWGKADGVTKIADGIFSLSTPSHGGYWLSTERMSEFRIRRPHVTHSFAGFPWFEEDCDWAQVALAFPEHFTAEHVHAAAKTDSMMNAMKARERAKMSV